VTEWRCYLIRLIEARFGVDEPNLTPWRRAVCGDLTSAFDFESSSDRVPPVPLVVDTYNTQAAYSSWHPVPPAVGSVPTQEPGVRPSRRLEYRFRVGFDATPQTLNLALQNHGQLGVGLQAPAIRNSVARRAIASSPCSRWPGQRRR
jgi:phospholipase C